MSRPLLITSGSRGDVEPMFALAAALAKLSQVERITLVIPSDQASLAPQLGEILDLVTFEFNLAECWKYVPAFDPDEAPKEQDPLVELRAFGAITRGMIFPHSQYLVDTAKKSNCNVIVGGSMMMSIAHITSQALNIPLVWLQFQPLIPSDYYPQIMLRPVEAAIAMIALQEGRKEDAYSEENHSNSLSSIHAIFQDSVLEGLNQMRSEQQLAPLSLEDIENLYAGKLSKSHLLVNLPSVLTPRTPDMHPTTHLVGSLAATYIPPGWEPDIKLSEFLRQGPKPVVVSYGSMAAQGVGESLVSEILSGLRSAGVERVVLLPGHARFTIDKSDEWNQQHVFVAEGNVQYAWLLPQCDLIMCHCGAGTVNSAIVAGVPIIATPVVMDQMFFAELVVRMGVAVRLGSIGLPSITADGVEKAVYEAQKLNIRDKMKQLSEEHAKSGENADMAAKIVVGLNEDS